MKQSYNEIGTRMLFGILAGAVMGYIGAVLPLLLEDGVLSKTTIFNDMIGGTISGAFAGALLGGFFVYSSARKRKYFKDISSIRDMHKDIFYNARSGGKRALALRQQFPEDFWRIAIKATNILCNSYDESGGSNRAQQNATAGLAALFRAVEDYSALIYKRERSDYSDISKHMYRYISLDAFKELVSLTEDIQLTNEEALRLYSAYFREAGQHLRKHPAKDIIANIQRGLAYLREYAAPYILRLRKKTGL